MSDTAHILPPREGDDGPEAAAARWLAYLYSGEATDAGRAEFAAWLHAAPAHARAYRQLQQTWRDLAVPGVEGFFREAAPPAEAEVVRFEARRPRTRAAARTRRGWLAAAAGLAATVAVGIGVWRAQLYDPVTSQVYVTAVGEVRTLALPDGSRLTLAAASQVQTEFARKRRHVDLLRGGAYFDVARDREAPFTVAVAATRVRVVGTRFEVDRASQHVRVSVAEGVVQVAPAAVGTPHPGTAGGVRLQAGQRVSASVDGRLGTVETFDPAQAAPWREGRLVYRNARLQDVVAEVNRYRTDKIVLADASLAELPITMAVRTDQTGALLEGLAATSPVVIERSDDRVVIRRKP